MFRSYTARERIWVVAAFVLTAILLFGGRGLSEVDAKEKSSGKLYDHLKIFTDVLSIVQRDYVREVDSSELVEGAIKGMLAALDPHSGYLDPDFYQDLQVQTKGEFGGLGIEITIRDGLLLVVAPMDGSPAERAGVRQGDVIAKIEGKIAKQFSLVDAVKMLRGPKGTTVNISIARPGLAELIDISIVRDNITVKSVRSRYLGDGFGYVRLSQFMEKTSDDLEKELKRISAAAKRDSLDKIKGLVLDVRNNPGGLLTEAVRVSDLFLKEGVIVYTDGRVEGQKQKFFAHARGTQDDYPIIVLINGGSASAAEILSGSLKDHGRALLLGTQTFGKGSVQTVMPLENGGAVTLTTALYYTKSGRSIQADGVSPDIEMEVIPEEDFKRNGGQAPELIRESDLIGAISVPGITDKSKGRDFNKVPVVQGNLAGINPEKIDLGEWYSRDPQLQRAVELLRTFDVFGGKEFVSFGEEEGTGIVG